MSYPHSIVTFPAICQFKSEQDITKATKKVAIINQKAAMWLSLTLRSHNKTTAETMMEMIGYLSVSQTIKAVVDGQHAVTLDDAYPDCCTHRRVHSSTGSSNVHYGHVDVALPLRKTAEESVVNVISVT